jgi:NAD-dependent deacetylase
MKKHLVVLSGAGISAESGLKTFRDSDGLWEHHKIEEVATPEAWRKNPALVNQFYNQRRMQLSEARPNRAHELLADLESKFKVSIITQNVDDLHERAGSTIVMHLHGELIKVRSEIDSSHMETIGYRTLGLDEKCPQGHRLRPHIVWFGEEVPMMSAAMHVTHSADLLLVIGTSLNVYPAAGLIHEAAPHCPIFLVDPDPVMKRMESGRLKLINEKATIGMPMVAEILDSY